MKPKPLPTSETPPISESERAALAAMAAAHGQRAVARAVGLARPTVAAVVSGQRVSSSTATVVRTYLGRKP